MLELICYNPPSDSGARRDGEAGEDPVGAPPAAADARPDQPQQAQAGQGEHCEDPAWGLLFI